MARKLDEFATELSEFMPKYIREASSRFLSGFYSLEGGMEEITLPQMVMMNYIATIKNTNMTDLAKALSVSTSAATGIVDRMVRSGLLRRVASEEDRRVIFIELTDKAAKIVEVMRDKRYKFIVDVFGKLDPAEREEFLGTMKKIYSILKEGEA